MFNAVLRFCGLATWEELCEADHAVGLLIQQNDLLRWECSKARKSPLKPEEREAINFACMNLMETARRAMQKCHAEEDIAPVSEARATLRALLERTK